MQRISDHKPSSNCWTHWSTKKTSRAKSKLCNWISGSAGNRWPCGYQNSTPRIRPVSHLNKNKQKKQMKINNHHYCRVAIILSYDKMGSSRRQEKKKQRTRHSGRTYARSKETLWMAEGKKKAKATGDSSTKEHSAQKKTPWEAKEVTSQVVCTCMCVVASQKPQERWHTGGCVSIRHMIVIPNT